MSSNYETTTKFKVDISELKSAMKTARRETALAKSEFKATSSALEDWGKSTTGVKAKLKQLESNLGSQKKVLSEYERVLEDVKREYGEDSAEAQEYQTKLNNQKAVVNQTEREIAKYTQVLDELEDEERNAGKGADKLGDELSSVGAKSMSAKEGFTVLRGAMADLVADGIRAGIRGLKSLGTELVNLGTKADDLNTLSKVTSVDVETLQEWEYASKFIDTSVDTMTGSVKRLTKNMGTESKSVQEAFKTLGVSYKNADGSLRDSNEVFMDLIDSLGGVSNETERDALAMTLFGKSATELNPLIEAGTDELSKLSKEARNMGAVLDEDTVNSFNDFRDALDRLKFAGYSAFAQIGKQLLDTGAIDKIIDLLNNQVIPLVSKLASFIIENGSTILSVITGIVSAIASAKIITTVTTIIGVVKSLFLAISTGVPVLEALGIALTMNPIGLVITAVVGLTVALITLWKTNDKFRSAVIGLFNTIKTVILDVFNFMINTITAIPKHIGNFIKDISNRLTQLITIMYTKGKQAGTKLLNSIVSTVKSLPNKIKSIGGDVVAGLWNGISNKASWLKSKISSFVGNVTDWLKKFFQIGSPSRLMAKEIGQWLPAGIGVGIENNTKSLYNSMRAMGNTALSGLDSGLSSASASAGTVVNNFNQTINSPKQLNRLDIYRQSKNLLGYAGGGL